MTLPAPAAAVPRGRLAGVLIVVASVASILAVARHPTASSHRIADVIAEIVRLQAADEAVHAVVMTCLAALLFAFTVFALRRGLYRQLVLGGLIAYAIGVGATLGAATVDGFIVPGIAVHVAAADAAALAVAAQLLGACAVTIQALTKVGLVAISLGMLLWSADLVRDPREVRAVGALGFGAALLPAAIVASGARMDPHLLAIVLIVQTLWYVAIGVLLVREQL